MHRRNGLLPLVLAPLMACSSPAGVTVDAGACPFAPLTMPWPSATDTRVCSRPLDGTPPALRTACGDITESCAADGVTAPALACLSGMMPPTEVGSATLAGYADVFSSGPSSTGARLEIYRTADVPATATDLSQVTPLATHDFVLDDASVATARACPKDLRDPEELHGACIQPTDDCGSCSRDVEGTDFCYQSECYPRQRWEVRYEVTGVPTNTFLVLRTIGLTDGQPDPTHDTWAPLVQYNVFLSTADPPCADAESKNCWAVSDAPRYQLNVNLLSRSDYETIPVTTGLTSGIARGHGGIAGEIHDCNDVRIEHAQIGYSPVPNRTTYFNDNPIKTLPDSSRTIAGTSKLGIYAGLDIEPGPLRVEAIGLVNGQPTALGGFTGRIWPDTVTIVGINGGKPVVAPAP